MSEARTASVDSPISVSQIQSMQRCPQAYLYRYGMGMIEPPRWAFAIGKAVEHGIVRDYTKAIATREHLPRKDVMEITREELGRSIKEEPPVDKDYAVGEAIDHVVEAAGVFHEEVAVHVQPTALEVELVYKIDDKTPAVRGFADVVAENLLSDNDDGPRTSEVQSGAVLIDNKTSGAAGGWGENDVAAALQPVAYVVGMEAAGKPVDGFQFHVARYASGGRWLKTKVTQVLDAVVTPEMKLGWLRMVKHAVRQREAILETGVALPLYGWQCKGCGFRDTCAKDWGREPPK